MPFLYRFTKRDLCFALLTGVITGGIGWKVFEYLQVPMLFGISWSALVFVVPIVWIFGVLLGYFLGQWMEFFNQFGKFATIGFTNFAVNAGVLNILLHQTGYVRGIGYSVITGISFIVAMCFSYIWNKFWAFRSNGNSQGAVEFAKFVGVTVLAFAVNVAIASFIVNFVPPVLDMTAHQWANVGTLVGSAAGLIFSFAGYRLAVFRR